MRDFILGVLLIACLGLYAAFIDERAEKYEMRRALDNATQQLADKDRAAFQAIKRPRK